MSAGMFTRIGNTFETAIGSFVSGTAANMIDIIAPLVLIGVTIYFLITGYMVMAGRISEPMSDILIKGAKIALIATFGLNTSQFMGYVAASITGFEQDLLGAVGGQGSTSIYAILDNAYDKGWDALAQAFQQAGQLSFMTEAGAIFTLLLTGIIGIIGLVTITCIGAGIVMLAKMALVVVLGLGPLFICCLMFPATAGWFDSWLKTCLNYVLTTVIAAAFIIIFMKVYMEVIEGLTALFSTGTDAEGLANGALAYSVLILIVAVVASYITFQVPTIASNLVGGLGVSAHSLTGMLGGAKNVVTNVGGAATSAISGTGKVAYNASNVASRGAFERGTAMLDSSVNGMSQNVSNRYAQYMRRDGSNSINS